MIMSVLVTRIDNPLIMVVNFLKNSASIDGFDSFSITTGTSISSSLNAASLFAGRGSGDPAQILTA